jgi:tRNA nucleotidyltransferase (CCA-adding enzyme)
MGPADWEHYPHPADMGIRGIGATKEEAFMQVALALTAVVTNPERVSPHTVVKIVCVQDDDELLLYDWLSKVLCEMATRNMLFGRFEVEIDGPELKARAYGEEVDVARHEPTVEVKAATYADLKVERNADGNWVAQCIVDV